MLLSAACENGNRGKRPQAIPAYQPVIAGVLKAAIGIPEQ
jgi:hypothetical protein